MFAKLHLLSQDVPAGGGLQWRAHPYLRMDGEVPRGPAIFDWSERQRDDLEALWRDPSTDGARERLARDLAAFCGELGWTPDPNVLKSSEEDGDDYLLTLSAVAPELYLLPWEVIQVGSGGTYLSDYASAQVRYAIPGLGPREVQEPPPRPGVLFAWSSAGGSVPHGEQAAAIRSAAEAGGAAFDELAEVDERSLQAALDAGPPSVLHLLCHGLPGPEGEPSRLRWGAGDSPSEITGPRLARMLRSHAPAIRLVVLSACGSGDGRGDPLFLTSFAQELHRSGIPGVVASRYPLSARGSTVMTRALYDQMLREAWSLERALRHTRQTLFRVDDAGEAHTGDAYGIQLYGHDTEWFVSDNDIEAERPILASYPFGTPARPSPAREPPAAELALQLERGASLSGDELVDKLRQLSEDHGLIVVVRSVPGRGPAAVIVQTTVDGAQRIMGAWRSKRLQLAIGVVIGAAILTQGIHAALAGTVSSVASQVASTTGKVASATGKVATIGKVAASGKAGAGLAAIIGGVTATKIAAVVVVGSAAIVGAAVYRSSAQPATSASHAPTKVVERADAAVAMAPLPARSATAPVDPPPVAPPPSPAPPSPVPVPVPVPPSAVRPAAVPPSPALPSAAPSRSIAPAPPAGGPVIHTDDRAPGATPPTEVPADAAIVASAPPDAGVEVPAVRREMVDAATDPAAVALAPDAGVEAAQPTVPSTEPASALPVPIEPSRLKAQQIAGDTDVPASRATKACMRRYHLDILKGTVRLCVDARGRVTAAMLTSQSDCEEYNDQLVRAVQRWRYRPYLVDGRATAVCSTVEFMYANH
ncbi:MAG TPA: CHAT domain-containing protein [Kofleriaceae bacterium]|nr:CHAT domain-containing protein [Kofleriaceae bacterium]